MNDPRDDEPTAGPEQPGAGAEPAPEEPAPQEPAPPGQGAEPGAEEPRPQPASTGRTLGVVLGLFALLIAAAAAGGVVFTWWQVAEQRELAAEQRLDAADRLAEIRTLVTRTEERLAAQEKRLEALDEDVAERRRKLDELDDQLRQARAKFEALTREEAGPERSPTLAEIEFLLLLAGRELALADNPRVALAALREADQRVARLDEPGLGEVRAAIHDEIAAVEAIAALDVEGIAMRLGSLMRRVDGLPLRGALAPRPEAVGEPDEAPSGWARVVQRVRSAGAELFRIRRADAPAAPLLAPDETFFLYRNVELDLKSARLAALARDQENYATSLESARRTLGEYFETGDESVRSLIRGIEELEGKDIAPRWPEISRSLALLRAAEAAD